MGLPARAQAPRNVSSLPANAFEHVYRHARHLQAADNAAAASGRSSNLSAYYKNLAGLNQQQAEAIQTVPVAALTALAWLDGQAKELILQSRAQGWPQLLPG